MNDPVRISPALILFAVAVLLGTTSLAYPETGLDLPTSIYLGRTILEGGLPYRDAWEARSPGVFFAYALQLLLLGRGIVALRVFDLLWQFGTAVVLAHVGTRVFKKKVVGLIAGIAYLMLYYSQNFWTWAEPDGFLSLSLGLSFLFLLQGLEEQRLLPWALAGALTGVAALFKLPFGLFGIGLLFAATTQESARIPKIFQRLLAMAVGFAAPLALCGFYFYLKGGLADLLTTQFLFAPRYVARVHAVLTYRHFLESALRPHLFPLYATAVLGLGSLAVSLAREQKVSLAEKILVVWLGVGVATFLIHGSYLAYHYLPLIAPLAVLTANPIHSLAAGFRAKGRHAQVSLIIVAGLTVLIPLKRLGEHSTYTWRVFAHGRPADPWRDLGAYIRERTSPQDTILIWGNAPVLYLHADRRAASRFLSTAYLSLPSSGVDYRKIFLTELATNKPRYFVLVKNGSITPGLPGSLESFRQFDELKALVQTEYQVEKETESYAVFRRREGRPTTAPVLPHPF